MEFVAVYDSVRYSAMLAGTRCRGQMTKTTVLFTITDALQETFSKPAASSMGPVISGMRPA
jgi:hypothetical protein